MTILYDVASIQVGVGRRYHGTIDAKPAGPDFNGRFDKDGGRRVPDYKTIARLVFTPYSFTAGEPGKREALPRLHTL